MGETHRSGPKGGNTFGVRVDTLSLLTLAV
ncbi:hypothetical protein HNQ08_001690 [Deinococcus humi]|uniref:Uncharacterized protein n=1 Tax=Deinococcus humi TaxID=662880 RepID=A0A7W8NEE4_9DEIO|nr:hypothetical protein [Deinococcus humi]